MNQRGLHFQVVPRPLSDMIRTSLPPVTIGSNALQQHADNWSTRPGEGIVQQELLSQHKAAIVEQLRINRKRLGLLGRLSSGDDMRRDRPHTKAEGPLIVPNIFPVALTKQLVGSTWLS